MCSVALRPDDATAVLISLDSAIAITRDGHEQTHHEHFPAPSTFQIPNSSITRIGHLSACMHIRRSSTATHQQPRGALVLQK